MDTEHLNPAMTRHVDGIWTDPDSLFAAGDAAQAFLDSSGFSAVKRVLAREISDIDRGLDRSGVLEQAEYARAHGRRSGLQAMQEAALAIVGRAKAKMVEQQAIHEGGAESSPEGQV